ncbi:MAG: dNTP triphosphohydrolase [Flavobacteriales bacterium]|nr:dNTP triphosphohydrolase [Flavobacteriales bacterium]MCX7768707.1 dNTP triphosphohydrolase [Flavobacteriales bacterium]MDW8410094.1 dNTP triphosphohydrolase [Flavobacteriales bacterium]
MENFFCTLRPAAGSSESLPDPVRTEFDKDYDRILFSHPFRRLQDKTQVVPLARHDFVHNRLTHSLETSVVGRTLGRRAGLILQQRFPRDFPSHINAQDVGTLVSAACLAHDIGNPPFGHAGEEAIGAAFEELLEHPLLHGLSEADQEDLRRFEGNAQGFRILADRSLRLTAALLATFMKYPCPVHLTPLSSSGISTKKFGFFQTEKDIAEEALRLCGLLKDGEGRRHPLTWLVEAADDICYLIIDLEDATRMGRLSFEEYLELLRPLCGGRLKEERLRAEPDVNESLGLLRALAINSLAEAVLEVYDICLPAILDGSQKQSLLSICRYFEHIERISQFSRERIYNAPEVAEVQAVGFEVLSGLIKAFVLAVEKRFQGQQRRQDENLWLVLPPAVRHYLVQAPHLKARLHVLTDWIAGLTDQASVHLYRRLKGIAL